jgi:hypothetical protein
MNVPNGQPAANTLLQILAGSPAVYQSVANMGDITGPGFSLSLTDVTSHSTGSPWDEFVSVIFSGGDVSFPLFFVPSSPGGNVGPMGHDSASGIMCVFLARLERSWQTVFSDAWATTAGPMNAILYRFGWKGMVKGVLRADLTMRLTGLPTLDFGEYYFDETPGLFDDRPGDFDLGGDKYL